MQATVADTMNEMLASTLRTMEILLAAQDHALPVPTTHVCGHGKDTWVLLTNLIDHETKRMQQVLQARYDAKGSRTPMERIVAEWLETRARFLGTLVGLTDEQFNTATEPGEWTFYEVADHLLKLEHHALATMEKDGALPVGAVSGSQA